MKHLKIMIMAALVTLLLGGSAFAQNTCESSGSVVLPRIDAVYQSVNSQRWTLFYLTNISSSDVECTMKIYDHDGNRIHNLLHVIKGNRSSTVYGQVVAQNTDSFTIPAKSTRRVSIGKIGYHLLGYGKLEWTSQDPTLTAPLIGVSQYYHTGSKNMASEHLINNGHPF